MPQKFEPYTPPPPVEGPTHYAVPKDMFDVLLKKLNESYNLQRPISTYFDINGGLKDGEIIPLTLKEADDV